MTISQITQLPVAPQRTDAPADFSVKADAHVASLNQFVTETNASINGINLAVTQISADTILSSANAASSSASAATSAANANFKGRWSDATGAATVPSSYSNNGKTWQLLQNIADITVDEPISGASNWQVINDINMSNVNVSELNNPLLHAFAKNDLVRVMNGATELTSERNTTANSLDINGIVRESSIDDPREEEKGWLFEGDIVNEALHRRDFTNAVWVKTNITPLKDAIGHDNVSNSASTLTATAANGTVFQTVTKASAENTYSIDVRRKTGTGVIEITDDGGSTFTDITSSINSVSYKPFQITTTQANPEFGVRIVTSGDEIEVDYAQLEVGKFASSRIDDPLFPAVSSARSTDDISFPVQGNFRESEGCIFLKADVIGDRGADQVLLTISDGTAANRFLLFRSNDKIRLQVFTNNVNLVDIMTTFDMNPGVQYEIGINYTANLVELFVDRVSIGVDTLSVMPVGLTVVDVGRFLADSAYLFGHIQDLRHYKKQRTLDEFKYLGGN